MKKKLILLLFFLLIIIAIPFAAYLIAPPNSAEDTTAAAVAKISRAASPIAADTSQEKIAAISSAEIVSEAETQTGSLQTAETQESAAVQSVDTQSTAEPSPEKITYTKIEETDFRIQDDATGKIITVPNKDFLIGTLACELSPDTEMEALKAQAVAAYTYYSRLRQNQRADGEDYDFSANTKAWLYYTTKAQMKTMWGEHYKTYYNRLAKAVDAVENETLQYNGALITAAYFAISSGQTENGADIWGGTYPYLTAVASPWDKYADDYKTTCTVTADDFRKKVLELLPKCKFSSHASGWITGINRTDSGSVKTIAIGNQTLDGIQVRNLFRLRSSNFTVEYKDNKFTFTVVGYGHGVGMSQNGAVAMAEQGSAYDEILAWYYPGTELVK